MTPDTFDLIIYHGNCPDGWCAAYVAKKKFPSADLVPAVYGERRDWRELCKGRRVLVVDFSWDRDTTQAIFQNTAYLQILDHHKTAESALEGLEYATFDMTKSGARLAWEFCFPEEPAPWFVAYVEDRDLWTWRLASSREVSALLMATPFTVEAWDALASTHTATSAAHAGTGITAHIGQYIDKVAAQRRLVFFEGVVTSVVCAAYPNISDVANALLQEEPVKIGMGWFARGDGMIQFSLRSQGDFDVSAIAKAYGGGGHKNAAGFQLPDGKAIFLLSQMKPFGSGAPALVGFVEVR